MFVCTREVGWYLLLRSFHQVDPLTETLKVNIDSVTPLRGSRNKEMGRLRAKEPFSTKGREILMLVW